MLYTQVNYSQVDYLEHKKETNFLYINADKQGKVLSGEDTNTVRASCDSEWLSFDLEPIWNKLVFVLSKGYVNNS